MMLVAETSTRLFDPECWSMDLNRVIASRLIEDTGGRMPRRVFREKGPEAQRFAVSLFFGYFLRLGAHGHPTNKKRIKGKGAQEIA